MAQAADEESAFVLQQVEPSPVEETPIDSADGDYFTTSSNSAPSSKHNPTRSDTSTLGLGNHSLKYYLLRTQKYSTYAFSLFTTFHLTNTALLPLLTRSLPPCEPYLLLTRPYYQSPLAEPVLITLPLLLHLTSGVALRLLRRHRQVQNFGAETRAERKQLRWPPVSGTSMLGFALVPLVAAHAALNRGVPLAVAGGSSDVGLGYVGHGFARLPGVSWVAYAALIGVGVWHAVWGWARWLGWTPGQVGGGDGAEERALRRKRRWYSVNGVAAVVAGVWAAGGLGVVGRGGLVGGWLGKEYDELYRHIPLLGRWV
ncbi:hypothetical protein EV356DRAFT_575355 [Viridothelium virens]|uniref:Mitochondrial adapter protein MCP1 transmembrane domain-containing protein n=1 Tax=Viridothelium virens TaxID=1048519 RepID=A0A6A6HF47_VIRVR|nr:hypothetical protein EV356DRAFT_575355 [Viridothelium virens]